MKLAVNELSFPVTHTDYSDARFDSYRILKPGQGAENFLDRLVIPMNAQVLRHKMHRTLTQLSNAYSYTHFQ
jgi:hypothetical protein